MPGPFPGLDPFIEGQLWSDFHTRFINALSDDIVPKVTPRYIALIEERLYVERMQEQPKVHIRPDVTLAATSVGTIPASRPATASVPFHVALSMPEFVREVYLELRMAQTHEVVTVIELLSPTNKTPGTEGRRDYLRKRDSLLLSSVHLVEVDFLRGGEPPSMAESLPQAQGWVVVSHSMRRPIADVWPVSLRQPLPTVSLPLCDPDPDIQVNLQHVFNLVYERAAYQHVLDYRQPLAPPMDPADAAWAHETLVQHGIPDPA